MKQSMQSNQQQQQLPGPAQIYFISLFAAAQQIEHNIFMLQIYTLSVACVCVFSIDFPVQIERCFFGFGICVNKTFMANTFAYWRRLNDVDLKR